MSFLLTGAFAQTDYTQLEVMSVTPKADKMDLFKKGMAAHNKKYHPAGPYHASVSTTVTGPGTGEYTWVMGPVTFSQLDSRPGKGEHDLDWEKNVAAFSESGPVSYWRQNKDISYQPEGVAVLPKGRIRYNYVLPGQMDRYVEQLKKVVAVYKSKKYKRSFSLWTHYGATRDANAVTINNYANWAGFDDTGNFVKDFDEVHGAGAFALFLEDLERCIDTSRGYDELTESAPELGG